MRPGRPAGCAASPRRHRTAALRAGPRIDVSGLEQWRGRLQPSSPAAAGDGSTTTTRAGDHGAADLRARRWPGSTSPAARCRTLERVAPPPPASSSTGSCWLMEARETGVPRRPARAHHRRAEACRRLVTRLAEVRCSLEPAGRPDGRVPGSPAKRRSLDRGPPFAGHPFRPRGAGRPPGDLRPRRPRPGDRCGGGARPRRRKVWGSVYIACGRSSELQARYGNAAPEEDRGRPLRLS